MYKSEQKQKLHRTKMFKNNKQFEQFSIITHHCSCSVANAVPAVLKHCNTASLHRFYKIKKYDLCNIIPGIFDGTFQNSNIDILLP